MAKVVVVNGSMDLLDAIEDELMAFFDNVILATPVNALAKIRTELPNLVVFCADLDDAHGCDLLAMIKMDYVAKNIPVLIYNLDGGSDDHDSAELSALLTDTLPPVKHLPRPMN